MEYLSGRNLNMVFLTFILRYVESKFTLLTYLMENNTVITVISYCTKGLNNSKTKQKPIPTIHNLSIKRRKKSAKVNGDGKKHRSVPEVFLAASPLVASAYGRRCVGLRPTPKFPPHARKTSGTQGNSLKE